MKNKLAKYWLLLLVLFFLPIIVFALNTWDTGYRVNHGGDTKEVIVGSAGGDCHKVTNNHSSNDYFVPTKTIAEWDAFEAHLPDGVSISECSPTCVPGDYYDWTGTCEEFCAAMGGSAVGVGVLISEGAPVCDNYYDAGLSDEIWREECDSDDNSGSPTDPGYIIYDNFTMCRCSCP